MREAGGFGGPGGGFAFAIGVDGGLFSSGFDAVGGPLRPSRSWDEVIASHKRAGRSDCLACVEILGVKNLERAQDSAGRGIDGGLFTGREQTG